MCARLARRVVAPHLEGEEVEGATPCFLALVRHGGGVGGARQNPPPLLPFFVGVAPSTVIPGYRVNEEPEATVSTTGGALCAQDTDSVSNNSNAVRVETDAVT